MKKKIDKWYWIIAILTLIVCAILGVTVGDIIVGGVLICFIVALLPYAYATMKLFHLDWLAQPIALLLCIGFMKMLLGKPWGLPIYIFIVALMITKLLFPLFKKFTNKS